MQTIDYFKTPIWSEQKPEWVKPLNKLCDGYIENTKDLYKDEIEKQGSDFGIVYHSKDLSDLPELETYLNYIGIKSNDFLSGMGYDLKNHSLVFTSAWVQEFPKDGGGNHNTHIHANNHVSGFFYLNISSEGSYPVFHDPRPAVLASALPQKNKDEITHASESFHYKPRPGTLIIIPAYLNHQYVVSKNDPFRFIHFNLQAIENRFLNND